MTTKDPSLSVVIPFYRDEAWIAEAVASAAGQPIPDLEIIVVNDNPGVESAAFLAGLAARFPIRVVAHDENRGLAAARNTGIEFAGNEFVAFLDADDVFIPGALALNLAFAARSGADLIHLPSLALPLNEMKPRLLQRDEKLFGRRIDRTSFADAPQAQYIVSSWASLYRRDFLMEKAVRFDEAQRRFEDRLFVLDAIFAAESLAFSDVPARVWRRRLGSITTGARAYPDIAMQLDLVTKCVRRAAEHAGEDAARAPVLQRELAHAITRVVWDVRVLEHDPAASPELDEARARLSAALAPFQLGRRIFRDSPTKRIGRVGGATPWLKPIGASALVEAYGLAAQNRWDDLHRWFRAQAQPKPRKAPMPEGRELILHVGLHKTGSTFLQRVLEQDRERLAAEGVLFPKTGFLPAVADNRRAAATPGHVGFFGALRQGDMAVFDRLAEEVRGSDARRVLISSENLSFPYEEVRQRALFLERAAAGFGGFDRIRVLAVVRRPDDYIERYWREHVFLANPWARRTAEQFAAELGPQMADLEFLLGDWRALAGGALTALDYDAERGLLANFYGALGLEPPAVDDALVYPSPSAEQAMAARAIALSDLSKTDKGEAFGAFLSTTAGLPRVRGGSALDRVARLALIDRFAERSAPFLRDLGMEPPVARWRREVESAPPPPAPDPAYLDAALAIMAAAPSAPSMRRNPLSRLFG